MNKESSKLKEVCIKNDTPESKKPLEVHKDKNGKKLNTGNKRPYKRYPKTLWMQIKNYWEGGKHTAAEISALTNVPKDVIHQKVSAKKWVKGANIARIQGTIAERNIQRFINEGIAQNDAIRLIVEGMTLPEMVKFEGKGENMLASTVPDYKTRLAFLQEYNKMCGNYAPMEKEGDKHLHFHVTEAQLKSMNASEAIQAYQNLQDS